MTAKDAPAASADIRLWVAVQMQTPSDVEECLVDGDGLHEGREASEHGECILGHLVVEIHVWVHKYRVGAELIGCAAWHCAVHAEPPSLVAARRDDSAFVWTRPDDEWPAAPLWVVQQLYDRYYKTPRYEDLWFRWQGKPLLLYNAKPDVDAKAPASGLVIQPVDCFAR